MGCFDELWLSCPECSSAVKFQSKAGKCDLDTYTKFDVPPEIAASLHGQRDVCGCGATVEVVAVVQVIQIGLRSVSEKEEMEEC